MAGLAAPVTDRQIVLRAIAREGEGCDQELEGIPQEYLDDTWTVHSLDVSVITLRNERHPEGLPAVPALPVRRR